MKTIYNTMNPKKVLGYLMAFAMVLFTLNVSAQCDHTLNMADSYGDGWNGASVDITVNGATVVAGATVPAGGSAAVATFSASSGDAIDLANWISGSYNSEISWDIKDGDGTVIASGVYGASGASTPAYCTPPPPCSHTFNMYDSYGDGWSGSSVDVTVNGTAVVTGATLTSGAAGSATFSAVSGDAIDLANWATGSWTSEVSWDITDGGGTVIASGAHGGSGASTANCPSVIPGCTDPLAFNYNAAATSDDGSCNVCAFSNVVTLPYAGTTLTNCGSGNNVTGSSYLGGEDGIYEFIAANTGNIIVDLVTLTSYTGLFVYDGCPSLGLGTLVASSGTSAGNESLSFSATAGATYYIVVDTWPSPNCIPSFDLSISEEVIGCMNLLAVNYDPLANAACANCCILAGCTSGIGTSSESFEDPAVALYGQGPWADWTYDAPTSTFTGTNGWRKDNLGTGSGSTGPANGAASLDGAYYLYCETSGQYGRIANLHSSCVDLTNFTAPSFVFGYNMYGATIGTLNIDVSTDGGTTWLNEWTLSGNQGQPWQEVTISLASYANQIVQVRMSYTSGTSYTGDCAIDFLRFMEAPVAGCMDALAANYNAAATLDDGSCLYVGCTDPNATNYDPSANSDDGSCTYPAANVHPFCEDVESQDFATNGWVVNNATYASATIMTTPYSVNPIGTVINPLGGAASILFDGGSSSIGWGGYTTEALAFANTTHVASASAIMDLSAAAASCEMSFNAQINSGFSTPGYSNLRVKVDGVVIADVNGNTLHRNNTGAWPSGSSAGAAVTYNMSAYSGQTVTVTFEYAGKYNSSYSSGAYGCPAIIDDICFYDLSPCSYFVGSATSSDVSCNSGSDGSASASASGGFSSAISYAWSDGQTTQNAVGLIAGTYSCIVSDANACSDTVTVIIGEPSSAVSTNFVIGNEFPVGAGNGQIDFTPSGGTPCIVTDSLISNNSGGGTNNASQGVHFDIINTSASPITITGFGQGNAYGTAGYGGVKIMNIWTMSGQYDQTTTTGWTQIANNVSTNIPLTVGGYGPAITMTPVVIPAGATQGFYVGTSTGSVSYMTASAFPIHTTYMSDANISITTGHGGNFGAGSFSPRAPFLTVHYGDPAASAYTYAWDNGATTEDLSGLSTGQYCVTVTDCNGCTTTACDSVASSPTYGCMDSVATNYFSFANIDDGSCVYDCSPFIASDSTINTTCNGSFDGSSYISVIGSVGIPTYSWDNGSNLSSIIGSAAGIYSCIVTDPAHNCVDTVSVTITEPTAVLITATSTPVYPGLTNGTVDITVSGGTPCATSVQLGSGTTGSYFSYLWYTYYHDGRTEITYTAAELAAAGMNPGDIMNELSWNILSQTGSAATTPMNNANMTVDGVNVWSGTYQAALGMNTFNFSTPVTYTGGDLVVEWCFDNTSYVSGNNLFESTTTPGTLTQYADNALGCSFTALTARNDRPNAYIGFQAASGYTFAWSTGDTTEDVSGL